MDLKRIVGRIVKLEQDSGGGGGETKNPITREEWRALAILRHVVRVESPEPRHVGISETEWAAVQRELARCDERGLLRCPGAR